MYTKEEKLAEATLYKALQTLWTIFTVSRRDLETLGQENN